jgi:hypothetical protein
MPTDRLLVGKVALAQLDLLAELEAGGPRPTDERHQVAAGAAGARARHGGHWNQWVSAIIANSLFLPGGMLQQRRLASCDLYIGACAASLRPAAASWGAPGCRPSCGAVMPLVLAYREQNRILTGACSPVCLAALFGREPEATQQVPSIAGRLLCRRPAPAGTRWKAAAAQMAPKSERNLARRPSEVRADRKPWEKARRPMWDFRSGSPRASV